MLLTKANHCFKSLRYIKLFNTIMNAMEQDSYFYNLIIDTELRHNEGP